MKNLVKVTKVGLAAEETQTSFDFSTLVKVTKIPTSPAPEQLTQLPLETEDLPYTMEDEEINSIVTVTPLIPVMAATVIPSAPLPSQASIKPLQGPSKKEATIRPSDHRGEPPAGFRWHPEFGRALSPLPPKTLEEAISHMNKWCHHKSSFSKKPLIKDGKLIVFLISTEEAERFKTKNPEGYYSFPTEVVVKSFKEVMEE